MTYRERREARAEKLREWSAKREQRAAGEAQAAHDATAGIPFGQPILVGHHSERRHRRALERGDNAMRAAVADSSKAAEMASKADEIDRQAANAIYSDDPDAIERLTEKIARLEAEREHAKQANATFRREHRAELKGMTAYQRNQAQPFPSYVGQNLSGNISRLRDRLRRLERERDHGPADRIIRARFTSSCELCGAELVKGELIRYNRQQGARCYPECAGGEASSDG